MKKIMVILFMVCLAGIYSTRGAGSTESENEVGKRVFDLRGCGVCHDSTDDQRIDGLGPSWKQIAEAYKGSDDALTKFLKGEGKPILGKAKCRMMHGQIILLKTCSDSEMKALVGFIKKQILNPNQK